MGVVQLHCVIDLRAAVVVNATVGYLAALIPGWRPSAKGYKGKCPAHGGKSDNSLAVFVRDDGSLSVKCWSGCTTAEIAAALGMTVADLRSVPPPPDLIWREMLDRARETGHCYFVLGKLTACRIRSALPGAAIVAVDRPWSPRSAPPWTGEFRYLAVWLVSDNDMAGAAFRRCAISALRGTAWTIHDIIGRGKTIAGWHVAVGPEFRSQLVAAIGRAGLRSVA